MADDLTWTPWVKLDVPILAKNISPIIHNNVLHIFWLEISTRSLLEQGDNLKTNLLGYEHTVNIKYVFQKSDGSWEAAQTIPFPSLGGNSGEEDGIVLDPLVDTTVTDENMNYHTIRHPFHEKVYGRQDAHDWDDSRYTLSGLDWKRIYPFVGADGELYFAHHDKEKPSNLRYRYFRFVFMNKSVEEVNEPQPKHTLNRVQTLSILDKNASINLGRKASERVLLASSTQGLDSNDYCELAHSSPINGGSLVGVVKRGAEVEVANLLPGFFVINTKEESFLLRYHPQRVDGQWRTYETIRLHSSVPSQLKKSLFDKGIEHMLSLNNQLSLKDNDQGIKAFDNLKSDIIDSKDPFHKSSAFLNYYKELFYYVPLLIAQQLNGAQQFDKAETWYNYLFNPSASALQGDSESNRPWQYRGFRDKNKEYLKDLLTNKFAIRAYKDQPFNPHAVARFRAQADQKAVMMGYVDNLLDWGDHLFAQDTMESVNEAALIYQMASDVLGKKPVQLGKCEQSKNQTYSNIEALGHRYSEFAIEMENTWKFTSPMNTLYTTESIGYSGISAALRLNTMSEENSSSLTAYDAGHDFSFDMVHKTLPLFCVPANDQFLDYWKRVEDRVYKIRHCMNIKGVKRQLDLFAPEVDPSAMIKAKALGLDLRGIMASRLSATPQLRFQVLLEKRCL